MMDVTVGATLRAILPALCRGQDGIDFDHVVQTRRFLSLVNFQAKLTPSTELAFGRLG